MGNYTQQNNYSEEIKSIETALLYKHNGELMPSFINLVKLNDITETGFLQFEIHPPITNAEMFEENFPAYLLFFNKKIDKYVEVWGCGNVQQLGDNFIVTVQAEACICETKKTVHESESIVTKIAKQLNHYFSYTPHTPPPKYSFNY